MKTRTLVLSATMMAALSVSAQEYTMQVVLNDGTIQSFAVENISEIKWEQSDYEASVTTLPNLLHNRINPLLIVDGNKYVIFGGHTDGFDRDGSVDVFADGAWSNIANGVMHDFGCMTKLKDGRTLIMGGTSTGSGVGQSTDAHIYDPATGSITATGHMNVDRALCNAACLNDGKVLVAGNWYNDGSLLEIYDPKSETFTILDACLPTGVAQPIIVPTADGGAAIFAHDDTYGGKAWRGEYYKYTPDGKVTSVEAKGWEGLTPCIMESHYDFEHIYASDGRAIFSAVDSEGNVSIVSFDPATETCGVVASVSKEIEGFETAYLSSAVITNKKMPYVHVMLFDSADKDKFCIKTINYNTGKELHSAVLPQNVQFSVSRLLEDGRILVAGGSYGDNYTGRSDVFVVKPL